MADASFTVNESEIVVQVDALYRRLSKAAFGAAIALAFTTSAPRVAAFISKNYLSGQSLRRRTGTLARSVEGRYEMSNGMPRIRVGVFRGPARVYAGIHERGGTIYPRRAKALAVPVNNAVTAAGVSRFDGPRSYPGKLSFVPISRGNLVGLLVDDAERNRQDGEKMKAAYLLLRKVRIKPRPFLRPGVMQYLPRLVEEVSDKIRRALDAARS